MPANSAAATSFRLKAEATLRFDWRLKLFLSERDHRIRPHRANGREDARGRCNRDLEDAGSKVGGRIGGADADQRIRDHADGQGAANWSI